MRTSVIHVMIALLLMPSVVCAMPACPKTEQNAQVSEKPHCAGKMDEAAEGQFQIVMLFVDCMDIDLQQSPQPFQIAEPIFLPDLGDDKSQVFWSSRGTEELSFHGIRGSPPPHHSSPAAVPVFLSTQRFRL